MSDGDRAGIAMVQRRHGQAATAARARSPIRHLGANTPRSALACRTAFAVDAERLHRNGRQAGFAVVNALLNQRAIMERGSGLKDGLLIVYLVVGLATVHRLASSGDVPPSMQGDAPLPRDVTGAISRRAVAAATGLPRETVRRLVEDLIAQGRLVRVGRNGVATAAGTFRRDSHLVAPLVAEVARCATILINLGVLVPLGSAACKDGTP